jgi:hypothetical protein
MAPHWTRYLRGARGSVQLPLFLRHAEDVLLAMAVARRVAVYHLPTLDTYVLNLQISWFVVGGPVRIVPSLDLVAMPAK